LCKTPKKTSSQDDPTKANVKGKAKAKANAKANAKKIHHSIQMSPKDLQLFHEGGMECEEKELLQEVAQALRSAPPKTTSSRMLVYARVHASLRD